jgi:mRNA interferase MazF
MTYLQGDVFWLDLNDPVESEPGGLHPCIIVQNDSYNRSAISTAVVCMCTSNLRLANAPGNVRIFKGEANLPDSTVANVSQVVTVNKSDLKEKIGRLSNTRLDEVINGIKNLLDK